MLLGATLALFGFGLVMVWSASSALAQERHGSPYDFLLKQAGWGRVGLIALVAALRLDYQKSLRRPVVIYPALIAFHADADRRAVPAGGERHAPLDPAGCLELPACRARRVCPSCSFLAYHIERGAERINEMVTLFPALLLVSAGSAS